MSGTGDTNVGNVWNRPGMYAATLYDQGCTGPTLELQESAISQEDAVTMNLGIPGAAVNDSAEPVKHGG